MKPDITIWVVVDPVDGSEVGDVLHAKTPANVGRWIVGAMTDSGYFSRANVRFWPTRDEGITDAKARKWPSGGPMCCGQVVGADGECAHCERDPWGVA